MFKQRFSPYIIGACILVLLSVSYVSYRVYQDHVAFKMFMSNAQMFNQSVEDQHNHSSHSHMHHSERDAVPSNSNQVEKPGKKVIKFDSHELSSRKEYQSSDVPGFSEADLAQRAREITEWKLEGKMSPGVQESIEVAKQIREDLKDMVIQKVITPDGHIHQVLRSHYSLYDDGDEVYAEALDPSNIEAVSMARIKIITPDGVEHFPPEEYDSIEDPYERAVYLNKFEWSIENAVSMAEVEKKVAQGELDFSLSEEDKRNIDKTEEMMARSRMLSPNIVFPISDKPPVKVRVISEEDVQQGDVRRSYSSDNQRAPSRAYSETDTVSGETLLVDTEGILSPSDQPNMGEPTSPPQSVVDIEKQLMPEGIEAELSEGLSLDRFDKAKQLIDQYGTEEGLRRLREMDPEAARRFESDKARPGRERRNPPTRDTSDDAASTQ
ncbi:hypothetical protein F4X33_10070 [Candidatus Poribacteria bacterium]|nr:hypothetical protein [Candidatus Poribacteria bacterium]